MTKVLREKTPLRGGEHTYIKLPDGLSPTLESVRVVSRIEVPWDEGVCPVALDVWRQKSCSIVAETLTSFFRYLAHPVNVVHNALVVGRAPPGGLGHELGAGVQVLAGGAGQVLRIHLRTKKIFNILLQKKF